MIICTNKPAHNDVTPPNVLLQGMVVWPGQFSPPAGQPQVVTAVVSPPFVFRRHHAATTETRRRRLLIYCALLRRRRVRYAAHGRCYGGHARAF